MLPYIRFETSLRDSACPRPLGVFRAVGKLRDAQAFDDWSIQCVDEVCVWFNQHLTVPRLPSHLYRAVFWFRAEQQSLVSHLWELVHVLREHEVLVALLCSPRPGRICYQDDYQVAAMPDRR
ncbi:MAG TPA: hypothetical protein VND64_26500 [Pirellulales bacterium]|nr:hypothetical protein [Pirellulales bacterium]